jgi:hypothetical protein
MLYDEPAAAPAAGADDPAAAALADEEVEDDAPDGELDEHPAISAATAAIATPIAAMRARLGLCTVLTAPLREAFGARVHRGFPR